MCRTRIQQKKAKHKPKNVHAIADIVEEPPDELFIDTIIKLHANTAREQAFAELELGKGRHEFENEIKNRHWCTSQHNTS